MYSKIKIIFLISFIFAAMIIGVVLINQYYIKELQDKDLEIAKMQLEIDRIGDTTVVYRLSNDIKAGNECMEYELEAVEVLLNSCGVTTIYDSKEVLGKYYLLDLKAGTQLTRDMFESYEVTDDLRYMDVVFDEIPIGLESGDYIDVHISFPLGQDYIALSHKRVAEINDSVIKLIVDQTDVYRYESMKTDLAMYRSTIIYGAQYISAGIQSAATAYYPVNLEVLLTMIKDPNIETSDYSNILILREQLEEQLFKSDKVDIAQTVTSGKQSISQKFAQASKSYDKLQMEKEKEAAAIKNSNDRR